MLLGVVGPTAVIVGMLSAISLSPWFSFTENALSDLGVAPSVAPLFNGGLIVGGILIFIFMLSFVADVLNNRIFAGRLSTKAGAVMMCVSALPLMCVGIFTEDAGEIHTAVATAFYVLVMAGEMLVGYSLLYLPKYRPLGAFAIVAGLVGFLVWCLPWDGIAIPETIGAVPAFAMVMSFAALRFNASKGA